MATTHESGITKQTIYKTLGILSIVTTVEIVVALMWGESLPKAVLATFFIVLSLLKAFYIVAEFMHMKYETKNFVFWTLITLVLLFWFIVAMLYEGNAWLMAR